MLRLSLARLDPKRAQGPCQPWELPFHDLRSNRHHRRPPLGGLRSVTALRRETLAGCAPRGNPSPRYAKSPDFSKSGDGMSAERCGEPNDVRSRISLSARNPRRPLRRTRNSPCRLANSFHGQPLERACRVLLLMPPPKPSRQIQKRFSSSLQVSSL